MDPTVIECSSRDEYLALASSPVFQRRHALERHIADAHSSVDAFWLPGFCALDEQPVDLLVPSANGVPLADGTIVPNWREALVCPICGLNNRQRAIAQSLRSSIETRLATDTANPGLYLMEQVTPMYRYLRERLSRLEVVGSEYLGPELVGGEVRDGIRHEDAEALSMGDQTFDFVLSCDVLEHVATPQAAIAEVFRVLRPGGELFLSIPFHADWTENRRRARLVDGVVEQLEPPVYHGNPLSEEGSLVFTDFGWEFVEQIRGAGFSRCVARVYWSLEYGYLGGAQFYFHAVK